MDTPDMTGPSDFDPQAAEELSADIKEELEQRRQAEFQKIFDAPISVTDEDLKFVERAMQDLALSADKSAPFIGVDRGRLFEFIFKSARLNKAPVFAMLMQLGDAASYMNADIFDIPVDDSEPAADPQPA